MTFDGRDMLGPTPTPLDGGLDWAVSTKKREVLARIEEEAGRVRSNVDDTVRAARHLPAGDLPWVLGGVEALAKAAFDLYDDVTDCLDDRGYEDPDGDGGPADVAGG